MVVSKMAGPGVEGWDACGGRDMGGHDVMDHGWSHQALNYVLENGWILVVGIHCGVLVEVQS
jgi:hypothetical protein